MLTRAAESVRPGGRLVYATCSSEPEENEQVVAAFLERRADFSVQPVELAGVDDAAASALATPEGYLRTRPDLHRLEAFFAAVVRRRSRVAATW
jgi:16S rRNA (cytosine967-C5)-methyltransferase